MSNDKITSIRIRGMRAIEDVTLRLDGLTVLIGDNGTGKSTIIEALEILRKAATTRSFTDNISRHHGGLRALLRSGAEELSLEASFEIGESRQRYSYLIGLRWEGDYQVIAHEWLEYESSGEAKAQIIMRGNSECYIRSTKLSGPFEQVHAGPDVLALIEFKYHENTNVEKIIRLLKNIQVHLPFDVRPLWLLAEQNLFHSPTRSPAMLDRVERLERTASNLANCFHTIRNRYSLAQSKWQDFLLTAKMGLGEDLEDISTPSFDKGQIRLELKFATIKDPIPASALSDGQLSFLAFLALTELANGEGLIAIDEPECHFHPGLLVRILWALEEVAEKQPVILSTHSDCLLDALYDPGKSVVLCELDKNRAVQLKNVNEKTLKTWLEDYRGIGHIRSEGYMRIVFDHDVPKETE